MQMSITFLEDEDVSYFGYFLKRLNHIRFVTVKPCPVQKRNATVYIRSGGKAPHISSIDARLNRVIS
jgi:hypothetical protein